MANEKTTNTSGLASSLDPTKFPVYGTTEDQQQEYIKSNEELLKSLENRFAQPNWFKVAAGFAKPQLGGFSASLGSAAEAMGENVEQQRAMAVPIAEMRAKLAQSKAVFGQNVDVSKEIKQWRESHPGQMPPPDMIAHWQGRSPDTPAVTSLIGQQEATQKQQGVVSNQQRLMLDAIQMKQAKGMPISSAEMKFLEDLPKNLSVRSESAPITGTPSPFTKEEVTRAQGDVDALRRELKTIPASETGRREIVQGELDKALKIAEGSSSAEPAPKKEEPKAFYPKTFTPPKVEGMSDAERNAVMTAWTQNADAEEKRASAQVNNWRTLAADPIYSTLDSQYDSAINLIKNNPDVAKKVFNVLRRDGGFLNQVMSAAQAGLGVNVGSYVANINVPVEQYARAGFSQDEQLLADRLLSAMLTVGGAKLQAQGFSPEKGQDTYVKFLEGTKANLQQNAPTALHNLQKDYVTFRQNKRLYDTVVPEYQHQIKSGSVTPYKDVIDHSPEIAKINANAREEMHKHETDYQHAIRIAKERKQARETR